MESVVYAISPLVSGRSNSGNSQTLAFVDDASLTPVLGSDSTLNSISYGYADLSYTKPSSSSSPPTVSSTSSSTFQVLAPTNFDLSQSSVNSRLISSGSSGTVDSTTGKSVPVTTTRLPSMLTFNMPSNARRQVIQLEEHTRRAPIHSQSQSQTSTNVQMQPATASGQQQQYNIAASTCGEVIILSSSSVSPPVTSISEIEPQILVNSSQLPPPSRARDSLPTDFFSFKRTSVNGFGVFAKRSITVGTMLGPIEGLLARYNDDIDIGSLNRIATENVHSLTIFFSENYLLSQESADNSNWTRFVRPAMCCAEQNLELFESVNNNAFKYYFVATRAIAQGEELRVWYGKEICTRLKIDTLEQRATKGATTPNSLTSNDTSSGHKLRNKIAKVAAAAEANSHAVPLPDSKSHESNSNGVEHRCSHCSKSFPRASNLQRHITAVHSGTVSKQFKCPLCPHEFNHVYNRNRHMKNKHNVTATTTVTSDSGQILASPILIPMKNEGAQNMGANHVVIVAPSPSTTKMILHEPAPSLELCAVKQEVEFDGESVHSRPESQPKPDSSSSSVLGQILSEPTPSSSSSDVFGVKSTPEYNKHFRCAVCYKRFSTSDRLAKHAMVHDESAKKLQCNICRRKFLTASALSCHTKTHSYSEEEPRTYDCPLCGSVFNNIQARKDHVVVHIKYETGLYHCPKCSKTFTDFTPIRKHMRSFHSDEEFPCSQCEKIFPRQDKLRLHMLCHTDHCEFKCDHCSKQFKRKDKLKEHKIRMHAPDRNERIAAKMAARMQRVRPSRVKKTVAKPSQPDYELYGFKCYLCRLGFKRRGMLVNHLAKRHPEVPYNSVPELVMPIVKTSKDYYCQYCDKVYKSSSKRKAHILKNHPGESLPPSNRAKNLPSDHPNPTYSATVGSITIEPHFCSWCHKQYASKAKLMQHQRKKHEDQLANSSSSNSVALSHSESSQKQIILVSNFADSSTSFDASVKHESNESDEMDSSVAENLLSFDLNDTHTDNASNFLVDSAQDLFDQNLNYIKEEFQVDDIDLFKGTSGSLTSDAQGSLSDEESFMNNYGAHYDVKNVITYDNPSGPFMTTHVIQHQESSLDYLFSEIDNNDSANPMLTSSLNSGSLAVLVPPSSRTSFTDLSDIMTSMSADVTGSNENDSMLINDAGWNAVCEDIVSMI